MVTHNYQGVSTDSRSSIDFLDIDGDQDLDIVMGSQYSNIVSYENIGDIYEASFIANETMFFPSLGLNLNPVLFTIIRKLIANLLFDSLFKYNLGSDIWSVRFENIKHLPINTNETKMRNRNELVSTFDPSNRVWNHIENINLFLE